MEEKSNLQSPQLPSTTELNPEVDYFQQIFEKYRKLLKKYHQVVLFDGAIVKTDPIFLYSNKTKNRFVKCTLEFMSPLSWIKRRDKPKEEWGDVYIDSMSFEEKNAPGGFVLENIRRGAVISGFAVMKSGQKPVISETEGYRVNWIYGDYIYINIYDLRIDKYIEPGKRESPYKKPARYSPYKKMIADNQQVSDDDIVFNI